MHIIYVDDSKIHQLQFKKVSKKLHSVTTLHIFDDADSALKYCEFHQVDLAFLDIVMPERDGMWLAKKLGEMEIPIVFVSSYNNYANEAFSSAAVHYLLKPVLPEKINEAMLRTDERFIPVLPEQEHELPRQRSRYPHRIFLKGRFSTEILDLTSVVYLTGSGAYTHIKTVDAKVHLSSKTLGTYADILVEHPDFIRVHRSHIVNKKFIKSISKNGRKHFIHLNDETELEISPVLKDSIYDLLE
jgi:two-component system LytT family response regulator